MCIHDIQVYKYTIIQTLWSFESLLAQPPWHNTALESPTLAVKILVRKEEERRRKHQKHQ